MEVTMKSFAFCYLFPLLLLSVSVYEVSSRNIPKGFYHSDIIITKWPSTPSVENSMKTDTDNHGNLEERQPGWMRQQLLRFGKVASKIGNAMGKHTTKISAALDKICDVIKTVIPLLAAICHVGEFGFCSATDEAPIKFSEAVNIDSLDLNLLDR